MSRLYIVATPIGNLSDMTPRAIDALKEADLVLCEDTRVTKKLLNHFGISTPVTSYHQHTKQAKIEDILNEDKILALVSDAGTPGISDPGNQFVEEFVKRFGDNVTPIPGASAMATAASIAGFAMDRFVFLGFPPHKNKRQKYFKEVLSYSHPVIFYESCHRITKALAEIKELDDERYVVVCRELTKKFETIYRGNIAEVVEKVNADPIKGEYTVIVKNI